MHRFKCIDCDSHGDWRLSAHVAASDASWHETMRTHKTWLQEKDLDTVQRERGALRNRVSFSQEEVMETEEYDPAVMAHITTKPAFAIRWATTPYYHDFNQDVMVDGKNIGPSWVNDRGIKSRSVRIRTI